MIDFETSSKIRLLFDEKQLKVSQIATELGLHEATVAKWVKVLEFRPVGKPAYLTLHFAPGECAQVDWGYYGSIAVGSTRRRLSFFVLVLCYSRLMYLEFNLAQSMEPFLSCHQHASEFLGSGAGRGDDRQSQDRRA